MSDIFSGILSIVPLFSSTFPDRPSFLTSFGWGDSRSGLFWGSETVKRAAALRQNFIALLAYIYEPYSSRSKLFPAFSGLRFVTRQPVNRRATPAPARLRRLP